jgi:hypothetical protein
VQLSRRSCIEPYHLSLIRGHTYYYPLYYIIFLE